jgi:hypothetical protein
MFPQSSSGRSSALEALSTEARLLLSTAQYPAQQATIRALLSDDVDWGRLIAMSFDEGTQPVLWRQIRRAAPELVPIATADHLRQIERAAEFRLLYLERRLGDALAALAGAGISTLLLKGAALSYTVYGSIAERPMADIDLLVDPRRVGDARDILLSAGWKPAYPSEFDGWYETMHHLPPFVDEIVPNLEIGLDLHTELFSETHTPYQLSPEELWRDAKPAAGLPEGVFVPSRVHQLLHCCLHYAWSHRLSGTGWRTYRDIAAICGDEGFDWSDFVKRTQGCNGELAAYWSLRLARSLAGADVPDEILSHLRPSLPESLLNLLEHHFAHEAILAERICPSDRMRSLLWKYAVHSRSGGALKVASVKSTHPWHLMKRKPAASPHRYGPRTAFSASAWVGYIRSVVGQ